jgi:predicted ATPase
VGFLLTGRPEAEAAFALVGTMAEPFPKRSITLGPLDEGGIRALVDGVLGGAAPPQLVAAVAERTGGNPFFAEETVRSLVDAGTVRRNGSWYLEGGWDAASVPPTIEGVLSARIDLLPSTASKVLQTASVIGLVVRRPLLQAVGTDVLDLDAAVERLVESAFLDPFRLDGDEALAFHHPLVLEVAYSRAVRRRRRELHRRVAEATEALYGAGDDMIDFLAGHLYLAEAGEKAVEYLLRAGERSKRLFANDEAVLHLTRGLVLLEHLPDTPERARQELRLQAALAPPLIAVRGQGAPEVGRLCERASQLGERVGATPELVPVLFSLVGFHAARGHLRQSSEFGEQLMAVAEELRDPGLVLVASFARGVTLFYRGQLLAARDHLERGIAIYRPEQHSSLALRFVFDPGVGCLRAAALVQWLLGSPDRALASATEALVFARQGSHPYSEAAATVFLAMLHQYRREVRATRAQAEATVALAGEHGFPLWHAYGRILHGWALVEEASSPASPQQAVIGQLAADLSGSLTAYEESGSQIFGPYWMALVAEACRRAGKTGEALSLVARGLEVAEVNDERSWEADLWRLRGELLLEIGSERGAEAEENLRQALATAARQGARGLELRAAVSLSRLWRSQGRTKEARETLAGVYGSFVEGHDTDDVRAAATLLDELGHG